MSINAWQLYRLSLATEMNEEFYDLCWISWAYKDQVVYVFYEDLL